MAKTTAKTTAVAPRKSRVKPTAAAPALQMNHAAVADVGGDVLEDLTLESLLDSLETETAAVEARPIETQAILTSDLDADTLLDSVLAEPATGAASTDADLDDVLASVNASDASVDAATPDVITAATAPSGEGCDLPEQTAETAAPTRMPRKHYSNRADRLQDRLGTQLADYTVLTTDAVPVDDDAVKAQMENTLQLIRDMSSKKQNWASKFFEFVAGKKADLPDANRRLLQVLAKDGHINMGKEGNGMKNLLSKPYSEASARAMGGNICAMMVDLKLLTKDGKGNHLPNPDSLLLGMVNDKLGLQPAAAAE